VTAAQLIPGAASGSVSFYDGTTLLGTVTLAADATASLTTSGLSAGSQSVTARYNQTPLFLGSVSAAATLAVAVAVPPAGGELPWLPSGLLVGTGLAVVGAVQVRRRAGGSRLRATRIRPLT
jgi:Bacterial Ig-like domain (group 3)